MASVEFRRPRRRASRAESEERHAGLWWQIALGVFVGMLAHSDTLTPDSKADRY